MQTTVLSPQGGPVPHPPHVSVLGSRREPLPRCLCAWGTKHRAAAKRPLCNQNVQPPLNTVLPQLLSHCHATLIKCGKNLGFSASSPWPGFGEGEKTGRKEQVMVSVELVSKCFPERLARWTDILLEFWNKEQSEQRLRVEKQPDVQDTSSTQCSFSGVSSWFGAAAS